MQVRIDARVIFFVEGCNIFDGITQAHELIKGITIPTIDRDQVTAYIERVEIANDSGTGGTSGGGGNDA